MSSLYVSSNKTKNKNLQNSDFSIETRKVLHKTIKTPKLHFQKKSIKTYNTFKPSCEKKWKKTSNKKSYNDLLTNNFIKNNKNIKLKVEKVTKKKETFLKTKQLFLKKNNLICLKTENRENNTLNKTILYNEALQGKFHKFKQSFNSINFNFNKKILQYFLFSFLFKTIKGSELVNTSLFHDHTIRFVSNHANTITMFVGFAIFFIIDIIYYLLSLKSIYKRQYIDQILFKNIDEIVLSLQQDNLLSQEESRGEEVFSIESISISIIQQRVVYNPYNGSSIEFKESFKRPSSFSGKIEEEKESSIQFEEEKKEEDKHRINIKDLYNKMFDSLKDYNIDITEVEKNLSCLNSKFESIKNILYKNFKKKGFDQDILKELKSFNCRFSKENIIEIINKILFFNLNNNTSLKLNNKDNIIKKIKKEASGKYRNIDQVYIIEKLLMENLKKTENFLLTYIDLEFMIKENLTDIIKEIYRKSYEGVEKSLNDLWKKTPIPDNKELYKTFQKDIETLYENFQKKKINNKNSKKINFFTQPLSKEEILIITKNLEKEMDTFVRAKLSFSEEKKVKFKRIINSLKENNIIEKLQNADNKKEQISIIEETLIKSFKQNVGLKKKNTQEEEIEKQAKLFAKKKTNNINITDIIKKNIFSHIQQINEENKTKLPEEIEKLLTRNFNIYSVLDEVEICRSHILLFFSNKYLSQDIINSFYYAGTMIIVVVLSIYSLSMLSLNIKIIIEMEGYTGTFSPYLFLSFNILFIIFLLIKMILFAVEEFRNISTKSINGFLEQDKKNKETKSYYNFFSRSINLYDFIVTILLAAPFLTDYFLYQLF
jgi:hypothetical protein